SNKRRFQLKNANRIRLEKHQRNKLLKEHSASTNEVSTNEVFINEISNNR
ncbi:32326_t:CDS:1, partial [Racocetra persica]